jgi:DNA-binding transcriptional MerR regulator
MNDVRFRTAEVAKFADVTLRQLQLWEECGVAVASRRGRVRFYTAAQTLFIVVAADLRQHGLSFQRLRSLSTSLSKLLNDHALVCRRPSHAYLLTDGRKIQLAECPNKTLDLVLNVFRPIVCIDLARCLDRIENKRLAD